jgi:hypothetical protein
MKNSNYILFLFLFKLINPLYFEVKGDKEKCFIDEFFSNSVVVIKYHIYGLDTTNASSTLILFTRY